VFAVASAVCCAVVVVAGVALRVDGVRAVPPDAAPHP